MQISITLSESPAVQHTLILQNLLGRGKFQVYHGQITTASLPDPNFALKVFPKSSSGGIHYSKEKHFLSKVSHPHIVTYVPILQHSISHSVLLTEYTPNGDFFELITNYPSITNNEKLMRTYFRQLMEGVEYLHNKDIAHLDFKLENLLLDKDFNLKIIDFDQSQYANDSDLRSGGTLGYRAPELIEMYCQDFKALDIYAVGVLLYTFLTGEMPFVEIKKSRMPRSVNYEMWRKEKDQFWSEKEKKIGKSLSQELRELLNGMWEKNVEKRMKVEDVMRSRWYKGETYSKDELQREMTKIFQ